MSSPRLFTSCWSSPLLRDVQAVPVSISRGEPRWRLPFKYRRARELAPDNQTWAHEDPEAFEQSYLRQLSTLGAEVILERLTDLGDGLPIIMLCWEKPGDVCHRRYLADFIEREAGVQVPELQPGMIARRSDSVSPTLF